MIWAALLLVSFALNAIQGKRILALENRIDELASGKLPEGIVLPSLEATDLAGNKTTVGFTSSPLPTLIYVFQPSCIWCERNKENLLALQDQLSGRYRILGISLEKEGTPDFVKSHQMKFPVYTDVSPSVVEAYHLGATPQTIVVSAEGKVLQSWNGAYLGAAKRVVEDYLSVQLPRDTRL